jgi:hypothetical protein
MKDEQEPIYSACIDLQRWTPKSRSLSAPSRPETPDGQSLLPPARGGAGLPPLPGAAAAIRLSRTSHDFGEVCVGEDEYWLLALHNEAEQESKVYDLSGLPSAGFSLFDPPALPFSLPPHGSRIIIVRYAPVLAGDSSAAALSITTNDPHFPVHRVLLTGAGVPVSPRGLKSTFGKKTDVRHRRRGGKP